MMTLKVLFVDYYSDYGGRNYYINLIKDYEKNNKIKFIDFSNLKINKNIIFRYCLRIVLPFYILYLQFKEKYDMVISNGPLIYPFGKNKNCQYKWVLYTPQKKGLEKRQSNLIKNILYQFIILYEKYSMLICNSVLTLSEYSKKEIIKEYPKAKIEILPKIIDEHFYKYKKDEKYKKCIFIPNFYRDERKGGDFLTPILINIAEELNKNNITIIISNRIINSQKENFNKISKKIKVEYFENIEYKELPSLYHNSLVVLTPATLEGYGLVPLEVKATGGKCISAPFPSLGFDNVLVNNKSKKTIVDGIIVLEHDPEIWEKEILNIIKKV